AECNPVLLAGGLLKRAIERGATIYAPCEVAGVQEQGDRVIARAKNGAAFAAGAVIYATGYERPAIVTAKNLRVVSTWAIATAPQPDRLWPSRATLWEASQPYLYVRTTPDGRVIAGGEDENSADARRRDALIPQKTEAIQNKLKALLPDIDAEAEYAWAGSFGTSKTGMPAIGLVPGFARTYAVEAFAGNGITFAMIAADIVHGALIGKPDPDADLFAFD
ncbi:MAG: FAD-binding oxidoreductase, partial [Pseudolabrys sp.]|nr:FAD-binding oxidoreductase [Pseudolabrys sp.]